MEGGHVQTVEGEEVCGGLSGQKTHTDIHIPTDYPGLILSAQDSQICSKLIKCLPLTYAPASSLVCEKKLCVCVYLV